MFMLDLSEVLMYKFYYDYFENKYGNKSRALLTDTDSFTSEIKTEYVDEDFSHNKEILDFSNDSVISKYYYDSNN